MSREPLSPELALVDPELAARARAALPEPPPALMRRPVPAAVAAAPQAAPAAEGPRPYPLWARVMAALWLLVLGILIGGAAIPHAQDRPRVVPPEEAAPEVICEPAATPETPQLPPVTPLGQP